MEIATPLPATARNDGSGFRLPEIIFTMPFSALWRLPRMLRILAMTVVLKLIFQIYIKIVSVCRVISGLRTALSCCIALKRIVFFIKQIFDTA